VKTKLPLQLKDLAAPGILALMWALFLLWYGANF
jgi:hypothetical protein